MDSNLHMCAWYRFIKLTRLKCMKESCVTVNNINLIFVFYLSILLLITVFVIITTLSVYLLYVRACAKHLASHLILTATKGTIVIPILQMKKLDSQSYATVCVYMCSVVQTCLTLCDPIGGNCQVPLSMEFFRQEYGSGVAISCSRRPSWPRDQIHGLAGGFFTTVPFGKQLCN